MSSKVVLYVYDLTQGMARQLSPMILGKEIEGIWHTGIVVFGREYYYGGGIQWASPGQTMAGRPLHTIDLGETHVTLEMMEGFLAEISHRFTPETYSLLKHNCNHFSNEVALFLTGNPIPNHIVGLPEEVFNTPMGRMIIPMIEQFETNMRMGSGATHHFVPWSEPSSSSIAPASALSAASSTSQTNSSASAAPSTKDAVASVPSFELEERNAPYSHIDLNVISSKSKPLISVDKNIKPFETKFMGTLENETDKRTIKELLEFICENRPEREQVSHAAHDVFLFTIKEASVKDLFAVLALFRLAASLKHFSHRCVQRREIIDLIVKRCIEPGDSVAMATQLMALCSVANLLSHEHAAMISCDPVICSTVTEALRSSRSHVRMMGATVAYNSALLLRYDSVLQNCEDGMLSYISALGEIVAAENDKQAQYRMMLALGHIAFWYEEGVGLLAAIEFEPPTNPADNDDQLSNDIAKLMHASQAG